tara:strand:- start:38223 stop:38402 length:180 start_codon:yes stop_codon:yes gene_type:complete
MKKELNDILACPICKSDLTLKVDTIEKDNIITGKLSCQNKDCAIIYPIKEGIPNLLPPQ